MIPEAIISKFLVVQSEGNRQFSREVEHYNLQMIIAVGFKVNNERLRNGGSILTQQYFICKCFGINDCINMKLHGC